MPHAVTSDAAPSRSPTPTGPLRDIRSFDGLRGVAAFLVVIYHYEPDHPVATLAGRVLERFSTMVDLFFVLSGFVMALTYAGLFANRITRDAVATFLSRRVARIYPLYLLLTAIVAVLVLTGHSDRAPRVGALPISIANLLLVQTWIGMPSLDRAAWSISTEWAAYLVFPFLVPLLLRRSSSARLAAIAATAATVVAIVYVAPPLSPLVNGRGAATDAVGSVAALAQCLADFILGIATYRIAATETGRRFAASGTIAIPLALVMLALLMSPAMPALTALLVLLFPPLLLTLAADRGPVARVLASRPLHRLGAWSYALYLVHPGLTGLRVKLIALATRSGLPHANTVGVALTIAVALLISAVIYRSFEVPARNLVRARFEAWRIGDRRPANA